MAWGRQDDSFWKHDKALALINQGPEGLEAIGAFWCLNSYTLSQHSTTFTIWEAAMVLRRSHDEAREILLRLVLAPEGYERGFLLRKQNEAEEIYEINSAKEYRSKNEAKARAGSQGGRKSGESRQAKSKQTRSKPEASAKQGSSKAEANTKLPIPNPNTQYPIPIPNPSEKSEDPDRATLGDFEKLLSDSELAFQISPSTKQKFSKIRPTLEELGHGVEVAAKAESPPNNAAGFALGVVVNERKRSEAIRAGPDAPPPKRRNGTRCTPIEDLDLEADYRSDHAEANG